LAEDEVLQFLAHVGNHGGVEGVIFAIELCLAIHASKLNMLSLPAHDQYFYLQQTLH
jgi:hypothetical protein